LKRKKRKKERKKERKKWMNKKVVKPNGWQQYTLIKLI
jgi:hypothetical protein